MDLDRGNVCKLILCGSCLIKLVIILGIKDRFFVLDIGIVR